MLRKVYDKIKEHRYKILAAVSFIAAGYFFYCSFNDEKCIKLSAFFEALRSQHINDIIIKGDIVYFRSLTSDWYYSIIGNYPFYQLFTQIKSTPNVTFACEEQALPMIKLLIPIAFSAATLYIIKPPQYGKQIYKRQKNANTKQKFQSYYGGQNIKNCLKQVIQYIKYPAKFQKMGLRLRRGILLYGPPGTGKTMLARIVANEAGLQFFSASASQFQQIFVGVGPKRIRDIFLKARSVQKGAIIFIDEIDAIGSRNQHWQTKQQRSTINQLLTQIDGFSQNSNIFIIGATNNISLVDPALLRPGRFDLKIQIQPPNQNDRNGIIRTLIRTKKINCDISENQLKFISQHTKGWCGADLENLLNESGYLAIRKNQQKVSFESIKESIQNLYKRSLQQQ